MKIGFFIAFIAIALGGNCQTDTTKLVKHTGNFRFTEGLYLNHSMMVNNAPIPINHIISAYNPEDFDFFNKLLLEKTIRYYDFNGIKKDVAVDNLYGFCRKGSLFINYGNDFFRIPMVGTICHFVANITVYEDRYNPSIYGYGYYNMPTTTTRTEVRQFLFHFPSGQMLEYSQENLELILQQDEELSKEYRNLSKKKKKQLKFVYLKKFNDRHPLYIPIE